MQVHYGEGVAFHTGPEPCAVIRKGGGRSVGRGLHRPAIEPRNICKVPGADAFLTAEGNMEGALSRAPEGPAWSETLACADAPRTGTGLPTNGQGSIGGAVTPPAYLFKLTLPTDAA